MRSEALPVDTFDFERSYMRLTPNGADLIVGDPDRVFPLASVTKPIAAYAVLVAVERGMLSLETPAGPPGATVRHLLAHASGLPFGKGDPIAKPGVRRIYSNYGYDVLADVVAEHLRMPVQEWVIRAVARPLGMDTFTLRQGVWPVAGSTAYPAGSIAADGVASADSLARFAMELLRPTLISRDLFTQAMSSQFDGISGILPGYGKQINNQWGLGFSIRGHKNPHWLSSDFSPRTIGHFGQSGSFIWMDPTVCKAGIFLGERPFGDQHRRVWPALTAQMRAL
ncbi:MAG: beta-lactamase family protein [Arcanobacterium sp.]|nr:beta-lactamase family protein [Arcanobacterium sp.]MDY5589631.1 serine hydrolase domain-containing protein [Arcanobacterium sp.]